MTKLNELLDQSINILKQYEPKNKPYIGAFSGGKDSVVIKELAKLAGVNTEWHYHNTTIDPPELIHFIKKYHNDVIWDKPKHGNFFNRMVKKGFPTRINRWCCAEYKESRAPKGSVLILGVRASESSRRKTTWQTITMHKSTRNWAVAPILNWSEMNVWEFIRSNGLKYCKLYDEGFTRLGCVGCPMAGKKRQIEFNRWPLYEKAWKRAFQRLWDYRVSVKPTQKTGKLWVGLAKFKDHEEMFDWWMSNKPWPQDLINDNEECKMALDMYSGGNS